MTQPLFSILELALILSVVLVAGGLFLLWQKRGAVFELDQSERELREGRGRTRMIIDQMPAVLWCTDEDLRFTTTQGAGLKKLGLAADEVVGLKLSDYFGTSDPGFPPIAAHLKALEGESTSFEVSWAGQYFQAWVEPLREQPGGPIRGAVCVALNVTDQRRTASALRSSEEQLRQAQKMEAVGRLAGGVAHDFNNLLTAMMGHTEIALSATPAEGPVARALLEIRRAGEKASALTRQLLVFSRKQVLEPKIVELDQVVTEMEGILKQVIGEDIELVTRLGSDFSSVHADGGQLAQVIMNLAVNARDAMPGGGKLLIETARTELGEPYVNRHSGVSPGSYVLLAVSDTGVGMNKATQARLFEPFFTARDVGKGTGLGLATVYGIVKQSGGNVWVYSEPGQGATFKVYLPVADAPQLTAAPVAAALEAAPGGSEKVLLVEDDEAVRSLLAEGLRLNGYVVLEARSGEEALRICGMHAGEIDLLVTDVVMPQMSGRDLSRKVREIREDLKTLFMSGYTESAIQEHGLLDAGTDFIQKPFTPAALSRKIRHVIRAPAFPNSPPAAT